MTPASPEEFVGFQFPRLRGSAGFTASPKTPSFPSARVPRRSTAWIGRFLCLCCGSVRGASSAQEQEGQETHPTKSPPPETLSAAEQAPQLHPRSSRTPRGSRAALLQCVSVWGESRKLCTGCTDSPPARPSCLDTFPGPRGGGRQGEDLLLLVPLHPRALT